MSTDREREPTREEIQAGHVREDPRVGPVFWVMMGTVGTVVLVALVIWFGMKFFGQPGSISRPGWPDQRDFLEHVQRFPEPRLQLVPAREMEALEKEYATRLNGYGWVNAEAGIIHIPIEDAMSLVVSNGWPVYEETGRDQVGPSPVEFRQQSRQEVAR